jgi:cystathionine gamma-synthase
MVQRSLSPETLAAQALGEADPSSGGLAPVINLSTSYEQQPDGSYPQGRVYTQADNPTSEHAEMTAVPGGPAPSGPRVLLLVPARSYRAGR